MRRESFPQPSPVIEIIDLHRLQGAFETCSTLFSNLHQLLRHALLRFATHALQPLPNRLTHGNGHTLPGGMRQFLRHPVRVFVLDVQAHVYHSTIYTVEVYHSRDMSLGSSYCHCFRGTRKGPLHPVRAFHC